MTINRRYFFQLGSGALAGLMLGSVSRAEFVQGTIAALLPRDDGGHHFILFSDCTSGRQGLPQASNLQLVNNVIKRIDP